MTTEEIAALRVVEVQPADANAVIELWDQLPEKERAAFRALALELRDSLSIAKTAEEARSRSLVIIDQQSAGFSSTVLEYLTLMRRHTWDDRTWSQRLVILSLIATLPLTGKAAGLAALGTAVRVTIPVVGMAVASLVGSGLDLVASTYRNLINHPMKKGEGHLNRITFDPKVYGGRPCIRGRVSVKDILDHLAAGSSREKILRNYPGLEEADISAALQFASRAMDHPILDVGLAENLECDAGSPQG
jgi:uncharacterized protein (DUF433 family)